MHMDIQFKVIKDQKTLGMNVNVVSKGKHVPKIEQVIWNFKERGRCYNNYSLFAQVGIATLPKIMIIYLMILICFHCQEQFYPPPLSLPYLLLLLSLLYYLQNSHIGPFD